MAARNGADPSMNPRLRLAVEAAKKASMTKDTLERAIKKGAGLLDEQVVYETVTYEGFAPHQVPVIIECLTDNRNRTAPEIRKLFEIAGGSLGGTGCVAWMFDRKGLFMVAAEGADEDKLMEVALEAGADDVKLVDHRYEITCDQAAYSTVGDALEAAGVTIEMKQITNIPKSTVDLDAETARKVLKLMEALDDHDDVQSVSANFNIPEETMAEIGAGG